MNRKLRFTKENISKLEIHLSGIYFLYDESKKVQYIGKSKDLRSRLFNHFRGESHLSSEDIASLKYFTYALYDEDILDEVESSLIMELKPSKNKQGKEVKYPRGFYLDNDVAEVLDRYAEITGQNKSDIVNESLRTVFRMKGLL